MCLRVGGALYYTRQCVTDIQVLFCLLPVSGNYMVCGGVKTVMREHIYCPEGLAQCVLCLGESMNLNLKFFSVFFIHVVWQRIYTARWCILAENVCSHR